MLSTDEDGREVQGFAAAALRAWNSPLRAEALAAHRAGRRRLRRRFGEAVAALGLGCCRAVPDGKALWRPAERGEGAMPVLTVPVIAWRSCRFPGGGEAWLAELVDLAALPLRRGAAEVRLRSGLAEWLGVAAGEPPRLGSAEPWSGGLARVWRTPFAWIDAWPRLEGGAWRRATAEACTAGAEAARHRAAGEAAVPSGPFLPRTLRPAGLHGLCPLAPPEKLRWLDALAGAERVAVDDHDLAGWLAGRLKAERLALLPPPPAVLAPATPRRAIA